MNFKALIGFLALSISTSTVAQMYIENAMVRAMPPGQKVTAAYMLIANNTAETRTLVGASSAVTSHIRDTSKFNRRRRDENAPNWWFGYPVSR